MKNIIFFLSICVFSCACSNVNTCRLGAKLRLINNTSANTTFEVEAFKNVSLKRTLAGGIKRIDTVLCFNNAEKQDGNYRIHVKNSKLDTLTHVGYFSNGIPSDSVIEITVNDKSILIKELTN